MLLWLPNRKRPTSCGAFATIGVTAGRSATGRAVLGGNLDGAAIDAFSDGDADVDVEVLAATDRSCLAWTKAGMAVAVVVEEGASAENLCRRLLDRCRMIERIGDWLFDSAAEGVVVAADHWDVRGWQMESGSLRCLLPVDGLLAAAAGHSCTHSPPGSGWHLDKLERLRTKPFIKMDDVDAALATTELGSSTSYTVVLEPARRGLRLRSNGPTRLVARQSA